MRAMAYVGLVALFLSTNSIAGSALSICVDENPWPPYTYWDKSAQEPVFNGYTFTLASTVLARLNQPYDIQRLPWSEVHTRAKTAALGAGCDMILDISATLERQQYLYFTQPIYQLYYSLVYSKQIFSILNIPESKNIKNYKICGVDSYNYGVLEKKLDIIRESSIQAVLNKLKNKQCDFFAVEAPVLQYGIKMGLYQFNDMGCVDLEDVTRKSYRLAVAKRYPNAEQLITSINMQIGQLRKEGEIAKMAQNHGVASDVCKGQITLGQ
ncbi:MAG: transporter substrate-binding domain-containing protein [Agitococcus sp.]|jgi:ABC-type amino acid transport substrate-binding protein|nr:transporter substrate-binding domain-containing protein [Moraxellaceae bacterium]MBP9216720.1 transporter substrate-binding domain-containing protein [Agitococcus sp.]MBK7299454.1 transporter substrate-binding domain-containing protein [Moraxellaceae bacterium]MBK8327356.1 transporter substrate-binding domain-containing protein [Moraxellaceae bacterium]MBK9187043.1 transporter substrate-binding domain-containing protein [Moraxellaceae bacterium]